MKTTRHSLLAKGIMVLLSLLLIIFSLTYSWFSVAEPTVDSTGVSIAAKNDGDFEYSIGFYNNGTGGDYKVTTFTNDSSVTLQLDHLLATDNVYYNLFHDYKPIDVTGDGATLIRPSMSYGNSEINTASVDYSDAIPNQQYISFDMYFRSRTPNVSIKLANRSWAKGVSEINSGENFTGASATRKSSYGDFSTDAIVGAVRIAFVPYEYSSTIGNLPANLAAYQTNTPSYLADSASLLWLPRPDLQLNPSIVNNVEQLTGWTLSTSASNVNHTYYNVFECQPAKADGYASGTANYHKVVNYSSTITPSALAASSQEFARIDNTVHIGSYYYAKVNVRIWIEGTDAESRRATSGGQFQVNFDLSTS